MTSIAHPFDMRQERSAGSRSILWGLWVVFLLVGAVGIYQRLTQGHLPAGYGSYVPWGLWVALYFHGVGIAGGAFAIGAGGYVLDLPGFRNRTVLRMVIVLAVAAIVPGFMAVWLDLGHMARSHRIFTSPSFTSMMAFNAWMYGAFMIVAAACFFLSLKRESGWLKPLLCLAIMFSVLFPSQSGAFFGVVDAKAFWHSALLPVLFLTSALTAGGAMLLTIRGLLGPSSGLENTEENQSALRILRNILLAGLIAYFAFEFAEFSIALWNPNTHAPAIELILWGPYWWVFWIIHLLVGGLVPLVLLLSRNRNAWTVAAVLLAVTFVSTRLNVLIPGQAVGEIRGLQEAFTHDRLTYIYQATAMEYLVGLFLVAVGMVVFFIGQQINRAATARANAA